MVTLVSLLVTSVVAIILAYKGYGFYAIITKAVLGAIITTLLSFVVARTTFRIRYYREEAGKIIGFGGWLTLSVIVRDIAQQIDRLLMPRLLSITSLGAYNRPKEFINQISGRLNGIFDKTLFPILSDIQDNKKSIQNAFMSSLYYMNIFSMLLSLTFIFNANLIIRVFFGEDWLELTIIFQILSVSLLFNICGRLADCYFRSLGLVKQQFFLRIIQVIINIIGLLIGYKWDLIGIAVAVLITHVMMIIIKVSYIAKIIDVDMLQVVITIMNSYRFSLFILPILMVSMLGTPNTMYGNVLLLIIMIISTVLIFMVFPSIVGKKYKNEIYKDMRNYLNNKLHI